jgi:hypothetical protein
MMVHRLLRPPDVSPGRSTTLATTADVSVVEFDQSALGVRGRESPPLLGARTQDESHELDIRLRQTSMLRGCGHFEFPHPPVKRAAFTERTDCPRWAFALVSRAIT